MCRLVNFISHISDHHTVWFEARLPFPQLPCSQGLLAFADFCSHNEIQLSSPPASGAGGSLTVYMQLGTLQPLPLWYLVPGISSVWQTINILRKKTGKQDSEKQVHWCTDSHSSFAVFQACLTYKEPVPAPAQTHPTSLAAHQAKSWLPWNKLTADGGRLLGHGRILSSSVPFMTRSPLLLVEAAAYMATSKEPSVFCSNKKCNCWAGERKLYGILRAICPCLVVYTCMLKLFQMRDAAS